jgi:hypothetical protein
VETQTRITEVDAVPTRSGNTRWVVRTEDGREFTTFRPYIGHKAERYRGRPAVADDIRDGSEDG